MADFGRVLAVNTHTVGDQLVGVHAAGVTVLQLDDASEFPPEGGTVSTTLGVLAYTSTNPDTDTIALAAGLPAGGLVDEDRVELWDTDRGAVATELIASVALEGDEDDGDPFEATVPQALRAYLPDGIRSGPGEQVEVDVDSGTITDVPGRTPQLDGQAVWNPHSFRTKGATGSTIATATHTQLIGWTDVETDGIGFLSGSWTIMIPAWYEMRAWVTWAINATGRRRLRIIINGDTANPARVDAAAADPEIETHNEATTEARLVEGDVVTAWVYQTSGADLDVIDGAFSIHRISL